MGFWTKLVSQMASETKLVNIKTNPEWKQDPDFVYIGRPDQFGNPFIIGLHGNRETVIQLYREWLANNPLMLTVIKARLKGKILGCYCTPKKCHGDVILEVLDNDD